MNCNFNEKFNCNFKKVINPNKNKNVSRLSNLSSVNQC